MPRRCSCCHLNVTEARDIVVIVDNASSAQGLLFQSLLLNLVLDLALLLEVEPQRLGIILRLDCVEVFHAISTARLGREQLRGHPVLLVRVISLLQQIFLDRHRALHILPRVLRLHRRGTIVDLARA